MHFVLSTDIRHCAEFPVLCYTYCICQVYGSGVALADRTPLGAVLEPRLKATVASLQLFSEVYRRDCSAAESHLLAKSTQGLVVYLTSILSECVCQVHGVSPVDLCDNMCKESVETIHHLIHLLTSTHGIGDYDIHILHLFVLDVFMNVEDIVKHVFPVDATTGKLEKMQMQKIRTYCDIRSDAYQHKRFKITEVKEHREKAVTAYKSTSGSRSAAYNRGRSGYNSRYQHNATGNDGHNSSRVFDDKPCAICTRPDHCASYCDLPTKVGLRDWLDRKVCFKCMARHDGAKGHRCYREVHPIFREHRRQLGTLITGRH